VLKNAEMKLNNDGTMSFIPNQNIFLAALAVIVLLAIVLAVFGGKNAKLKQKS
jgi:hypothetical protein